MFYRGCLFVLFCVVPTVVWGKVVEPTIPQGMERPTFRSRQTGVRSGMSTTGPQSPLEFADVKRPAPDGGLEAGWQSVFIAQLTPPRAVRASTTEVPESIQLTSGTASMTLPATAPWTTIGSKTQAMRWEIRLHGWGSGQFPSGSPIVLPGSVSLSAYAVSKFQGGGNTQDIVFNNG